jgi:hypothetical protein
VGEALEIALGVLFGVVVAAVRRQLESVLAS